MMRIVLLSNNGRNQRRKRSFRTISLWDKDSVLYSVKKLYHKFLSFDANYYLQAQ